MWFFMNTCYILSLLTFVMLLVALVQNFLNFDVINAGPLTFIILVSIIYLFTETLVIFFCVGTGVSIKEYTQNHHLKSDYHKKSISIKRIVYPPQMLNILLMMILFILMGAVDTMGLSIWVYRAYFILCLLHFIKAKVIQHRCFRENTENVLAMSGLTLGK